MPEGTIERFDERRGFGFIRPETDGPEVFFHETNAPGVPASALRQGTRVSYQVDAGPRGPRARDVRLAIASASPSAARERHRTGYRFLNPYNFVRPLRPPVDSAVPDLLGRCPPPPHDRYVGLTGRVTVRLTTTTPLFIADSEDVREDPPGSGHLSYRFFQYDGRPAIPGSSLRGAVRSIFEAATSSCFVVFDGNRRLSYHLPANEAPLLVPARLTKNKDDAWQAELLTGTTPFVRGQRPQGPQYAAWIRRYVPIRSSQTMASAPRSPYAQRPTIDLKGWAHGDECQALIEQIDHPRRGFSFWNVTRIAPTGSAALRPERPGQQRVTGYLCITNQNIESKHDERLFFQNRGARQFVYLDPEVVARCKDLIADYQERHADEVERRVRQRREQHGPGPGQRDGQSPALSWFVYERPDENPKVQDGDLVYVMLTPPPGPLRVKFIVPVSVPRVSYDNRIGVLMDEAHRRCSERARLCPACRVFGWVWADGDSRSDRPEEPDVVSVACSGRVRFSHADLSGDPEAHVEPVEMTLAILSGPKPTTTRFYLRPAEGKPVPGLDDDDVGYDAAGQRLRGRKVFRHHGQLDPREALSVDRDRSNQNRTVRGVIKSGSVFEFEVAFENLASVELGALLWSIELEGWHHRLGFGKPLGFGSARANVTELLVYDLSRRYADLADRGRAVLERKVPLVQEFKQAMSARYGSAFAELANIRDLRALLAEASPLPVHYPRPGREPNPQRPNYEWFIGNKRAGRDAGPRLPLPLAADDIEGLPLMDRYGRPTD